MTSAGPPAPGSEPAVAPPLSPHRHRGIVLAVAAIVLIVIASSSCLHGWLLAVVAAAGGVVAEHPVAGVVAFIGLSAVSAMVAFVSSAVLVPIAVAAWGAPRCVAYLWLGWMLGGLASYGVARWLGRPLVTRLGSDRLLRRYERLVTGSAPFGLVVAFQLALPSEVPGYLLGLARYPLGRYLAALGLVELPYAIGTVLLGAGVMARRVGWIVALGAAAAITAVASARILKRRLGQVAPTNDRGSPLPPDPTGLPEAR